MKSAVCSRSSTAMRSPPSVILGMLAVAALPTGFARRSSILRAPDRLDWSCMQLVDDHTDQLALGAAETGDDVVHAAVDIEVRRQRRDQSVGDADQLALVRAERRCRAVDDDKVMVAAGTCLRDRLSNGLGGTGSDRGQHLDVVFGLDPALGLAADREPAEPFCFCLARTLQLVG